MDGKPFWGVIAAVSKVEKLLNDADDFRHGRPAGTGGVAVDAVLDCVQLFEFYRIRERGRSRRVAGLVSGFADFSEPGAQVGDRRSGSRPRTFLLGGIDTRRRLGFQ